MSVEFADFSVKVAFKTAIELIIAERKFSKLKNYNDAEQIGVSFWQWESWSLRAKLFI